MLYLEDMIEVVDADALNTLPRLRIDLRTLFAVSARTCQLNVKHRQDESGNQDTH